jgi:peptidoglycan/xylan/chitin deacetylase (PgdA/CDA1 family)
MSNRPFIVTTSWDDGHPMDLKLGELLQENGIAGTFFVPIKNIEQRAVMTDEQKRKLGRTFEIGAHTVSHVDLTLLTREQQEKEIRGGKTLLEDITETEVVGFCYPRGRYNKVSLGIVAAAGYSYARTAKNFCSAIGGSRFEVPTTIQFFPHCREVYLRNLVKYGVSGDRLRISKAAASARSLLDRVMRARDVCANAGGYFHIWGHSWELEEYDLWRDLDTAFRSLRAKGDDILFLDNRTAVTELSRSET